MTKLVKNPENEFEIEKGKLKSILLLLVIFPNFEQNI